jgi:acetyl-CoA C-acetyltransferase
MTRERKGSTVIVAGARTPIGRLGGALGGLQAVEFGGVAIAEALRRAGVAPDAVDSVVMGHVLQAGAGQITARQAAVAAGIPLTVPALTVNKVCLSGLQAIHLADLAIRAGEAEIVVAGGMESMTNAPYLLPGARQGFRMGDRSALDSMLHDGLRCAFDHVLMGEATESHLRRRPIARERQDELAALSHERAARATKEGRLGEEIVPVSPPARRGEATPVTADEGIRPETTTETLARLRPAKIEEKRKKDEKKKEKEGETK